MVAIRTHRIGSGGLAHSPTRVGVHRVSYEAAVDQGAAQGLLVHRVGVSVFAKTPTTVGAHRVSYEAAVDAAGAQELRIHRVGNCVFMKAPPRIGVHRVSYEAAADAGGAQPLRVHRVSYSVLGRSSIPSPTPIALASELHFFLHNWVSQVTIETSYTTDVFRSPRDGAEERTSKSQRPERILEISWLRSTEDEIRELLRQLRRLSAENIQIPLYPDDTLVTGSWVAADSTVTCDTRAKRFFAGGRVVLYPRDLTHISDTQAIVRTISSLTGGSLTFTEALGVGASASTYNVVPLLDCEIILEPSSVMRTDLVGDVSLTVREIHGSNALPPLATGNPDGAQVRNGYPVFETDPDWSNGLKVSYLRYGAEQRTGLRLVPTVDSTRAVLTQEWNLGPLVRAEYGFIAGFFDSRRGRGRAFWVIDRHDTFSMISNLSNTIFVTPKGSFEEFEKVWTETSAGAGIVLNDGTTYVVKVFSVNNNGSTWSLTLAVGQSLPILDATQITRFSRARLSRFSTDVIREVWRTTGICEITLDTIETPNEKEVTF